MEKGKLFPTAGMGLLPSNLLHSGEKGGAAGVRKRGKATERESGVGQRRIR